MIKVVQVGLGPFGQIMVRCASERRGVKIVAAVDPAPDKAGRDLGELCSLGRIGIPVCANLKTALKRRHAEVAILTTNSCLNVVEGQIEEMARAGLHTVSTCEELAFPWRAHPGAAKRIDSICRAHNVACVGTGVNPGFLMDYLPCVLSSVCRKVKRVMVTRVQDASDRRVPFQQKIGAGLTRARFRRRVAEGTLRHVGLAESMHMIARCFNWKLDRVSESLKPVIAAQQVESGWVRIEKGQASGIEQIGRGYIGGKEVIRLHFRAAVGERRPVDAIEIVGSPGIRSVIPGGVNGDVAACSVTVNMIRLIQSVGAGLKTMLDFSVPGFFDGVRVR